MTHFVLFLRAIVAATDQHISFAVEKSGIHTCTRTHTCTRSRPHTQTYIQYFVLSYFRAIAAAAIDQHILLAAEKLRKFRICVADVSNYLA